MSPRLKTALTFTAGLVVGALVMGTLQMRNFERFMNQREWMVANESALYLQMLSSEKGTNQMREVLFDGLPNWARRLDAHREDLDYAGVLWSIRLAYSLNERPIPEELKEILANLPAEAAPRCNGTRKSLGLAPLPASQPPSAPQSPSS